MIFKITSTCSRYYDETHNIPLEEKEFNSLPQLMLWVYDQDHEIIISKDEDGHPVLEIYDSYRE